MVLYNLFLYDQWTPSPTLIWPLNQSIFRIMHNRTDLDSGRQEHQFMQHIKLNPFTGLKPVFKGFDSVSEKQHTTMEFKLKQTAKMFTIMLKIIIITILIIFSIMAKPRALHKISEREDISKISFRFCRKNILKIFYLFKKKSRRYIFEKNIFSPDKKILYFSKYLLAKIKKIFFQDINFILSKIEKII